MKSTYAESCRAVDDALDDLLFQLDAILARQGLLFPTLCERIIGRDLLPSAETLETHRKEKQKCDT